MTKYISVLVQFVKSYTLERVVTSPEYLKFAALSTNLS